VALADQVTAIQSRIGLRELEAAMRTPRFLAGQCEASDQRGERVRGGEEPLEARGGAQRPGQRPNGVSSLRRRGVEAPARGLRRITTASNRRGGPRRAGTEHEAL